MSFREAVPLPEPPTSGSAPGPRWGTSVQQTPCAPHLQILATPLRPGDPVDPVTLFYNELQMSTYIADKRMQWARGLPVFIAVSRLHASGK